MARWSPLPNPRERAMWGILELGSLAKQFKSYNPHHIVIVLYLALS